MQLLAIQLRQATEYGDSFVTVMLHDSQATVARVAQHAEILHWHVVAVWRNESTAVTNVLLKHRPE